MIKAEQNTHADSNIEEMRKAHKQLMAVTSLEKRTKAKGKCNNLFKEKKEKLKKDIEKLRRD